MNKVFDLLKKKKYIYIIITLIILIAGGFFTFRNKKGAEDTIVVSHSDFISRVSVSGRVIASESADLGFYQGGRISSVRVKVGDEVFFGDIIASIDNGDLLADLKQKQANLLKEQTNLKSMQTGTRPEQIAITESAVTSAQVSFTQTRTTVINAINDAYTQSDDAIKNKIDQFFRNSLTSDPAIVVVSNDLEIVSRVNINRVIIGDMLNAWRNDITEIDSNTDLEKPVSRSEDNLNQLKLFLADVSLIINSSNSNYNGSAIPSSWKTDTSTARLGINTSISNLSSAVTTYKTAQTALVTKQNNLKLEQAGSTALDIESQIAQVKSAEADVSSAQALLAKTLVLAPFNGKITKMDAKVGEIASSNVSLISIMSSGIFEIESYVPEVNITRIQLGDEAGVTLDAYGENILFNAKVISIDPAETIRDGVATYKVKLQFSQKDERIKSGMTANVSIVVFNKPNTIVLPGGVIFEKDGKKFVQVKNKEGISDQEVLTGNMSSLGQTEVVSGLSDGEVIILNPTTK